MPQSDPQQPLADMIALLQKTTHNAQDARDKEIVLVLGPTGAGKSTLINALLGRTMVCDENEAGDLEFCVKNPLPRMPVHAILVPQVQGKPDHSLLPDTIQAAYVFTSAHDRFYFIRRNVSTVQTVEVPSARPSHTSESVENASLPLVARVLTNAAVTHKQSTVLTETDLWAITTLTGHTPDGALGPVIGHTGSCTTYPKVFQDPTSHLAFCDTAGVFDTRGEAFSGAAYYALHVVAKTAKALKGLLFVCDFPSLEAGRGGFFIQATALLTTMLRTNQQYGRSVFFVITKTDGKTRDNVLAKIKRLGQSMQEQSDSEVKRAAGLVNLILQRPECIILAPSRELLEEDEAVAQVSPALINDLRGRLQQAGLSPKDFEISGNSGAEQYKTAYAHLGEQVRTQQQAIMRAWSRVQDLEGHSKRLKDQIEGERGVMQQKERQYHMLEAKRLQNEAQLKKTLEEINDKKQQTATQKERARQQKKELNDKKADEKEKAQQLISKLRKGYDYYKTYSSIVAKEKALDDATAHHANLQTQKTRLDSTIEAREQELSTLESDTSNHEIHDSGEWSEHAVYGEVKKGVVNHTGFNYSGDKPIKSHQWEGKTTEGVSEGCPGYFHNEKLDKHKGGISYVTPSHYYGYARYRVFVEKRYSPASVSAIDARKSEILKLQEDLHRLREKITHASYEIKSCERELQDEINKAEDTIRSDCQEAIDALAREEQKIDLAILAGEGDDKGMQARCQELEKSHHEAKQNLEHRLNDLTKDIKASKAKISQLEATKAAVLERYERALNELKDSIKNFHANVEHYDRLQCLSQLIDLDPRVLENLTSYHQFLLSNEYKTVCTQCNITTQRGVQRPIQLGSKNDCGFFSASTSANTKRNDEARQKENDDDSSCADQATSCHSSYYL